jgi:tight adherence protein B
MVGMSPMLSGIVGGTAAFMIAVAVRDTVVLAHRVRVVRRFRLARVERDAPRALQSVLVDALPEWDPRTVWRAWTLLVLAVGAGGLVVGGWSGAAIAVAATGAASGSALWSLRGRRAALADDALVQWIDASSRAVRAGASFSQALVIGTEAVRATPLAADAEIFAAHVRAGDTTAGIDALQRHPAAPARSLVGRALAVAHATGGPPGILFDGVSATLRERTGLQREVRALATQARASALVIGLAPVAFAVLAAASDPRVGTFLLRSPIGWLCIATGLLFDLLGAAWMARLVRGV